MKNTPYNCIKIEEITESELKKVVFEQLDYVVKMLAANISDADFAFLVTGVSKTLQEDLRFALFGDFVNFCDRISSGLIEIKKISVVNIMSAFRADRRLNITSPSFSDSSDKKDWMVEYDKKPQEEKDEGKLYGRAVVYRMHRYDPDERATIPLQETVEDIRSGKIKTKDGSLEGKIEQMIKFKPII